MPTEITNKQEIVKLTKTQAEDFETLMASMNFVIGRYVFSGANVSQIICPNQDEMVKHAREYNEKTNKTWMFWFLKLRLDDPIQSVLFKEVNSTNKQVTYMFQKDTGTVVKMTVAME